MEYVKLLCKLKRDKENRDADELRRPARSGSLVEKRMASGAFSSPEEVFRRALEAQDAEESWTEEERLAFSAHIEEGIQQAERGELIDGDQARREIQTMKSQWLRERFRG